MDSGRFETFIDAILAIMMTVMILKIPQPEVLSLKGLWDLKILYFAYFISFIIIASIWNNHRKLFDKVEKIDNVVIFVYLILTFVVTLIPYFTSWVAHSPFDIVPEICYGLIFFITLILYLFTTHVAVRRDKFNKDLDDFRFSRTNILVLIIYICGFILAFTVNPIWILIFCCLSLILWNVPKSAYCKECG
ncbi:hypothetical protein BGI41_02070 [Methanobrevibacter sp. 87.7]|uniref:TMEM175 family protein n=1 Tax=Methanobrevibacter sp. 87.7 TaxID=387957 RepID=UPI000B50F310|nr:TMEM175 family protein [Methanobrevibacter sp. 87.7]OWT33505.1 hypothetical protein BGI41_02070 [Methanobrevibacter sp. 87.7]